MEKNGQYPNWNIALYYYDLKNLLFLFGLFL
ncbi:hypothetical protein J2Y45_001980 [Dyadobacter sp. BE34]|uniref:Uncharacterized protein n=1 Tax=Dyadobacter fermentans TaxID=94254 RepID=A0ABU1QX51_9BACT|nr:hypothetical protein [Dyadobacter fermentans]MDR7042529.1 hypothetical protein [Dyadobacter sp. BE242]MDR7196841.1 hypothetical protein [Dyadobacter sp. BE34]MDR7215724.1 hypothetical protein [Dyadobacter sp. BE31]MDR7263260.1 hypothetical protein [Dyadobacter sp. BE32]